MRAYRPSGSFRPPAEGARLVLLILLLQLAFPALPVPGDLDASFGNGGRVLTDFGGLDAIEALVIQPDGKLMAAGYSGIGDDFDFILARYNPNGGLDTSFGNGGRVRTDFGFRDLAAALVLQPDGKLVAAGRSGIRDSIDFILARYNRNGALDPSFGNGGRVRTDFGSDDRAVALVLQPDGKLVAAGASFIGGDFDLALARYNIDGALDTSFGDGGRVLTDFGGTDEAAALVLQPDGKLVAAGASFIGGDFDIVLGRYDGNGRLDPSFGDGGRVITDFGGSDFANALVLQPDGKLGAAGAAK